MFKIIITDIPEDLYRTVKDRARREKRSLSGEVIACLETTLGKDKKNIQTMIVKARETRNGISAYLTDDTLRVLKSEGRA